MLAPNLIILLLGCRNGLTNTIFKKKVDVNVVLFAAIDTDESTWSFSDGQVIFTLEKSRQDEWPQIRKVEE